MPCGFPTRRPARCSAGEAQPCWSGNPRRRFPSLPPGDMRDCAVERDFPRDWMWSEACEMLARAERMHREFFRPVRSPALAPASVPTWEPPVDVLETGREVLVLVALPGVDPDRVEGVIEDDDRSEE